MNGLFTLLIFGWLAYMLFSRKGGMGGCCGGHHDHHRSADTPLRGRGGDDAESSDAQGPVIDLAPEDYQVLSDNGPHEGHRVIGRDAPQAP